MVVKYLEAKPKLREKSFKVKLEVHIGVIAKTYGRGIS